MLLVSPHCKQFLPFLPTLHGGDTGASPAQSLTSEIGVYLHLAFPHEDPSQYPEVELVFALGLSGCHSMGAPMVWVSVEQPQVQSPGCRWGCCRSQGGTEGLQHLGSLSCVLPHKSLREMLRILQTNHQMLLEIQAKFMDIFCRLLCCQTTFQKKVPHPTRVGQAAAEAPSLLSQVHL